MGFYSDITRCERVIRTTSNKKAPKVHTKSFVLYVVKTEDKILIVPEGRKAYKHFKRWAYQHIASKAMYWDSTANLYAIDLEKAELTIQGNDIVESLVREFDVKHYLPFED